MQYIDKQDIQNKKKKKDRCYLKDEKCETVCIKKIIDLFFIHH
jgi:hypothetical protein